MKRFFAACAVAFALILPFSCQPVYAQLKSGIEPGRILVTRVICLEKDTAEQMARSMVETGSFDTANALLMANVEAQKCAILPIPTELMIEEVGQLLLPFLAPDGELIEPRTVRVGRHWTVALFEVPKT